MAEELQENESTTSESTPQEKRAVFRSPSDEMFHKALSLPKFARACLRDVFPDKVKRLDLRKLVVEQSDFYTDNLEKRVADLIYTVPPTRLQRGSEIHANTRA